MRLLTIAGLFFPALSVSAQSTDASAAMSELLAELAKLPACAVRYDNDLLMSATDLDDRHHVWPRQSRFRSAHLAISLVCVPMRRT